MGEEQARTIVANMIVAPNLVLKDIQKKYYTPEGNLDFEKIIPDKGEWETPSNAFHTKIEFGRDNLDGCIRFFTLEKPAPKIGRVLSLWYPSEKMAYLSVFLGSFANINSVVMKRGRFAYEKEYDLHTRHGRIIYKTVTFGMVDGKENDKEMTQG